MHKEKQGFTLVELSIVLVIVGLLIGGILVAQSMINTTKLQALIRQIGQFDAAVANFETKFNGLPGDIRAISQYAGTAGLSDGNGFITSTGSASAAQSFSGEVGTFWRDLSLMGLSTEGQGSGNTPSNTYAASGAAGVAGPLVIGTNANVPRAKAGRSIAVFIPAKTSSDNRNSYVLGTTGNTNGAGNWVDTSDALKNGALKPSDALALESKLDDGIVFQGKIRAARFSPGLSVGGGWWSTCVFWDGADDIHYIAESQAEDCTLGFTMGLNTGNLK